MKRILSLVLVLALVLGSVPVAFAAEESAGDMLKTAGFVAGDQDGNLNEDQPLTREQMMVLIAEMNGVKEEAATFGIPADFSDVSEDDWFAPYVWYAFYQGWTAGMGDGSFGAGVGVDSKMASTFMLKALGYEVADYNTSVEEAAEVGIVVEESAAMTRGEGFTAMWSTVNLPKKGSEVALGVELGKLEEKEAPMVELAADLDAVEAIGNTMLEVTFADDVDAAAAEAADYVIVEKGTTTALEVKGATAQDTDMAFVEVAAMKSGQAYTMTLGEVSVNFTGIAKVSDKPEVDSIKGTDTDRVEVKFDAVMDKATAEDIANYSIDKIGTVTGAELQSDNKTVELVVEGFTKVQSAKMSVENVLSIDGVAMAKTTKTFYATFDKSAPKLDDVVKASTNNVEVTVYFTDDHGVDEATAEDVSNYSIDGLEILEAVASKKMLNSSNNEVSSDYYNKVVLTTSEQSKSKKYTLKINNMIDGSSAANAITKELSDTFYGGKADTTEPKSPQVTVLSLTQIAVSFTESNELDPASALDLANYSSVGDEFDILDAMFKNDDDEETVVWLTVSELDEDESYKLEVNNIADVYGNAMDDEERDTFRVGSLVTNAPTYISGIQVTDLENIVVTFAQPVTEVTAEDPTNYVVDGDIGRAVSASFATGSDTKVEVKFEKMSANKSYELTVNGVETFSGYATEDSTRTFVATATSQDTTKPTVESVDNEDQGIVMIEFSEEMMASSASGSMIVKYGSTTTTLSATAVTGEDDNIVVFNAVSLEGTERTVEVLSFSGVKDTAGLTPDYTASDEEFDTASSYTASDYALQFDGAFQENINEINVEFPQAVAVAANTTMSITGTPATGSARTAVFSVKVDSDDDSVVILKYVSGSRFKDDDALDFDLNAQVTDLVNRKVDAAADIELTWDADDEAAPEIIEVKAVSDKEVHVIYDEDIDASNDGSYKIVRDDDKDVTISSVALDADDASIVVLTLTTKISSEYYYTLTQKTTAEDLAGNDAVKVDDGVEFLGNSTPFVANTIDGIAVVNGSTVKIVDDETLPAGHYTVKSGTTAIYQFQWDGVASGTTTETIVAGNGSVDVTDAKSVEITMADFHSFVEGQAFTVEIGTAADTDATFSESFDGIVDELTFGDLNVSAKTLEVNSLDDTTSETVYVFYNETGDGTYAALTAGSGFTQSGDTLTFTTIADKSYVKVIVKDADSGVILYATDNVQVEDAQ